MPIKENNACATGQPRLGASRLLGLFYRKGHVYGAVFSLGGDGRFQDYMPMDFIGTTPKTHTEETAEFGLLMPISDPAASALAAVMEMVKNNRAHPHYYYKSGTSLEFNPEFERTGCNPVDYDGSEIPVSDEEKARFTRDPTAHPIIPTDCIHMLLNACRHSAHIPLQDIDPVLTNTYQADALPYAIDRIAFYGEPLTSPTHAKWVDVPGGSAVITLSPRDGNIFRIPDSLNTLFDKNGVSAATSLLRKTPLDHTVTPQPQITEKAPTQRVSVIAPPATSMNDWL